MLRTTTKAKPYAEMAYSEEEFQFVRSSIRQSRQSLLEKWEAASDANEKAFYSKKIDQCDVLLGRYDAVLVSDTSQDANADDYPEE